MKPFSFSAVLLTALLAAPSFLAAEDITKKPDSVADEANAKAAFTKDYDTGAAAIESKNWVYARQKLTSALKALGDFNDPRKSTAQVLLTKAERALIKDDALFTASELMRLKQWVEAEEAFRKVVDVSGETETLRNNVLACRAGLEAENENLKKASALLKEKKWKDAIAAFNKASDTLGGIRVIQEGINAARQGIDTDEQLVKAAGFLAEKKWDDAFNIYKKLMSTVGETDEIKKGLATAQAGYAEDHKPEAPKTDSPKPEAPKEK